MISRTIAASAATRSLVALAVGAAMVCAAPAAWAQKKVPGEKWRQTVSMEMEGMSLPATTSEVCLPKGQEKEAAAQPPDRANCRIYDTQQSGNRFSAKIECTGKDAMRGSIETISEGERVRSTMKFEREGQTMTMRSDTTRLGTACEALDYSDYKPPAAPVVESRDICAEAGAQIAKDPARVTSSVPFYVGPGAVCKSPAQLKPFCEGVQTPAVFLALKDGDRQWETLPAEARASMARPLQDSMAACGLGKGDAAVDQLRMRLLPVAREQTSWAFLILEGEAADFARLQELAKEQCSGRSFTSAKSRRYSNLCLYYGAALARGDRTTAQEIASGRQVSGGDAGGGSGSSGGSASGTVGADGAAADGTSAPAAEEAPSATKELMKKGRGVLRGILGGG